MTKDNTPSVVDPKDLTIEHVEIWERWQTIDDVVYREWKTPDEKEWHRKKTAHKDNPWVVLRFLNPIQYERLQSTTEIKEEP